MSLFGASFQWNGARLAACGEWSDERADDVFDDELAAVLHEYDAAEPVGVSLGTSPACHESWHP